MAQLVEHILGKDEVPGSNPGISLKIKASDYSDAIFISIRFFCSALLTVREISDARVVPPEVTCKEAQHNDDDSAAYHSGNSARAVPEKHAYHTSHNAGSSVDVTHEDSRSVSRKNVTD